MSAGKSSELIRRIERARLAYLPTIIIRPATDTRSRRNVVESRNGLASNAIVVDNAKEIAKYATQAVVIGIDECQFFCDQLVDVVLSLLRQKKKLIAAGSILIIAASLLDRFLSFLTADRVDKLLPFAENAAPILHAAPSASYLPANKF